MAGKRAETLLELMGQVNEVGHHGTQIGALRDLYAWRGSALAT
jgi:hypothetical protein